MMALFERNRSGKGQVIDSAMIDGVSYLATFIHKARYSGVWSGPRGTNLLDSGAPFYDTYKYVYTYTNCLLISLSLAKEQRMDATWLLGLWSHNSMLRCWINLT